MQEPVHPLTVVQARAVGAMRMRDEKGLDDKIITVAVDDLAFADYTHYRQLAQHTMKEIRRFFEDYQALENKQVIVEDFMGPEEAIKIIKEALELYRQLRRAEVSR
jgi:inorganic pyrophosphatase